MLQLLRVMLFCRRETERGQAMVEYGLIIALIALVGAVGLVAMGGGVTGLYSVIEAAASCLQGPSACYP